MLLSSIIIRSAEITPLWNLINDVGAVQDMEMLSGEEEFISLVSQGENGQIQIRNVADGRLLKSFTTSIFPNSKIVFTPDSTKIIYLNNTKCEVRNVDDDFQLVRTIDLEVLYTQIAIDPIRPYVYVTGVEMQTYNYETGEFVSKFEDYISDIDTRIDISRDGKYLATLNNGKAYLKVWDLDKMELIRNIKLWDDKLPGFEWRCESRDVHFSKYNSNILYYSGHFPKKNNDIRIRNGIFLFDIVQNTTSEDILDGSLSGRLVFDFKESRVLIYEGNGITFFNLLNKQIEYSNSAELEYPFSRRVILSNKLGIYIGCSGEYMGAIVYDPQTSVGTDYEDFTRITPNPTTNLVTVTHFCEDSLMKYRVNDFEGKLLTESNVENIQDDIKLDFTDYPSGVYFLSINCNSVDKTYKIIKED